MLKKSERKNKNFIKNLIKEEILNSEVIIELRKGKFQAYDEIPDLKESIYQDSEKDFILIKSDFKEKKEINDQTKKFSFFKHKFVPDQEKKDFEKMKKNLKTIFLKNEKKNFISEIQIPEIKCDFLTNKKNYTFDLKNKKFFIKKNASVRKNTNILYEKYEFRLTIAKKEKNILKKKIEFEDL